MAWSVLLRARKLALWMIFVDEPLEVLNEIKSVEYVLHPTFPKPLQVRRDPRTNSPWRHPGVVSSTLSFE